MRELQDGLARYLQYGSLRKCDEGEKSFMVDIFLFFLHIALVRIEPRARLCLFPSVRSRSASGVKEARG